MFVRFFSKKYLFVLDFDAFVGDTPRLDTSAHKAKAQLALKVKRQPPSRSKLKETLGAGQQTANVQVAILVDNYAFRSLNVCSVLSVFAIISGVRASFRLWQGIIFYTISSEKLSSEITYVITYMISDIFFVEQFVWS